MTENALIFALAFLGIATLLTMVLQRLSRLLVRKKRFSIVWQYRLLPIVVFVIWAIAFVPLVRLCMRDAYVCWGTLAAVVLVLIFFYGKMGSVATRFIWVLSPAFRPDDWVYYQGQWNRVVEIELFHVLLETPRGIKQLENSGFQAEIEAVALVASNFVQLSHQYEITISDVGEYQINLLNQIRQHLLMKDVSIEIEPISIKKKKYTISINCWIEKPTMNKWQEIKGKLLKLILDAASKDSTS